MKIIFDEYTWKARIWVAVLVSLPILLAAPWVSSHLKLASNPLLNSAIVIAACFSLISTVVRHLGVIAEKQLLAEWGGYPSTVILQWRNNRKSNEYKAHLHNAVRTKLNIQLLTKDEEAVNPNEADKRIEDAFNLIKSRLWGKTGLPTHTSNVDYGFARNLYGSRWVWLVLCILSSITLGLLPRLLHESFPLSEFLLSIAILILVIIVEWRIMKNHLTHCAYRYAEHAWSLLETL